MRGTPLFSKVYNRLVHWRWSPQQIAARQRLMHPADPTQWISHEAIYAAIYAHPRGALKQGMLQALRQRKAKRGVHRTTVASGHRSPEELRIVHRPDEVQQRLVPGHWEGDFIKGSFNRSAVGTVVERKTRYVVLCRMDGCTAEDAIEGFCRQMKTLPAQLRQSFTYDRGSELACFEELSKRLNMDVWFADPYAPWQRGSNENTNGLLRQCLPKGTDLSTVSQTRLNDIARLMNNRPRKTLGWKTPAEALAEEMEAFAIRLLHLKVEAAQYWLPRSECTITPLGRWRRNRGIRNASQIRDAVIRSDISQPTTTREYKSSTTARYAPKEVPLGDSQRSSVAM